MVLQFKQNMFLQGKTLPLKKLVKYLTTQQMLKGYLEKYKFYAKWEDTEMQ